MRTSLVAGFLVLLLAGGGIALGQSRCDSGVSKAAGRKVKCKMDVVARAQRKGVPPDAIKLANCEHRFETACLRAQANGDCDAQTQPCAVVEIGADTCVAVLDGSPSGAFLE